MRKSIFIPLLIIPFVLVSCSDENKQITTPTNQNISSGSTQTIPKINTGTVSQSGAVQTVGTVSTGSIETVKSLPVRTLAIKNNNVVLMEGENIVNKLTVKGNSNRIDTMLCKQNNPDEQHIVAYKFLSENGNYGIVEREDYPCGADRGYSDYLAMNLMDGSMELTDISKYIGIDNSSDPEISYTNGKITETISGDNIVATEIEMEPGLILASNVKKAGFVKQGKNWIKIINLEKVLPKPTEVKKEPIKQETIEVNTPSVSLTEGKYAISLKSEYGSDLSSNITIKKTGVDTYGVNWDWWEVGYQEGNPDSSRNDGGRGVLKMKGGSGILTLTEWDEESTCATFSVSVKNNTLSVSRSGRPGMCSFNEGTYIKK